MYPLSVTIRIAFKEPKHIDIFAKLLLKLAERGYMVYDIFEGLRFSSSSPKFRNLEVNISFDENTSPVLVLKVGITRATTISDALKQIQSFIEELFEGIEITVEEVREDYEGD